MHRRKLQVLVLSDFQGNDANVIRDFLYSFHQYSAHEYFYLHSWKKNNCLRLRNLDLNNFDAIVLFWDYFWPGIDDVLFDCCIPSWVVDKIAQSSALKIQFLQDEYREVRKMNAIMARLGVNLMFTCVAEEDHELFYPKSLIPSLRATHSVLTGYVSKYLVDALSPSHDARPIDVGYRSRNVPFHLGRLGQEKVQISHRFEHIGPKFGLTTNVSVREEDRIYGDRWLDFLRSSRFSLGTESGASVIDFDGEIRRKTNAFLKENPTATFEEVHRLFLADVDGKAVIQTISPRIFEAAAFGNTLVLHEGRYEKMIEPDVHYISIKKDYANIGDVVERMRDRTFCQKLARNAREELVQSGKYDYRRFVERFDRIVSAQQPQPTRQKTSSRTRFYAMNYLHQDCIIPVGRSHSLLPHPTHLLNALSGKAPNLLCMTLSAQLMLKLCADNDALRTRLLAWLRNQDEPRVSLGGLARDLRILALLQRSRSGMREDGSAFDVRMAYEEGEQSLVFRSMPTVETTGCANGERLKNEQGTLRGLHGADRIAGLAWDHGQVGDSFVVPHSKERFFLIFINREKIYRFDHFHALFAEHPDDELAALDAILFPSFSQSTAMKKARTLWQLVGSACSSALHRGPLMKLRAISKRWLAGAANAEQKESVR